MCSSDLDTIEVKLDLEKAGINKEYFDEFFQMLRESKNFTKEPKNFYPILEHYNLLVNPSKLLIIGDRKERDIKPAIKLGCNAIQIPEYIDSKNNTDLSNYIEFI